MSEYADSPTAGTLRGAAVIVTAVLLGAPACGGSNPDPIALVSLSGGRIAVLEQEGELSVLPASSRNWESRRVLGKLPRSFEPLDMTSGRVNGEERLLLLGLMSIKLACLAHISIREGSPNEPIVCQPFMGPGTAALGGIVRLSDSPPTFVATSPRTSEIFAVELRGGFPARYRFLLGIPRAQQLSAVTAGISQAYAADAFEGVVYAIDINRRRSVQLHTGLGEIYAMAFDRKSNILYVADAAHRVIWSLLTTDPKPSAKVFIRHPDLRRPTALAVTENQEVWVGDSKADKLLVFSPDGKLISDIK